MDKARNGSEPYTSCWLDIRTTCKEQIEIGCYAGLIAEYRFAGKKMLRLGLKCVIPVSSIEDISAAKLSGKIEFGGEFTFIGCREAKGLQADQERQAYRSADGDVIVLSSKEFDRLRIEHLIEESKGSARR